MDSLLPTITPAKKGAHTVNLLRHFSMGRGNALRGRLRQSGEETLFSTAQCQQNSSAQMFYNRKDHSTMKRKNKTIAAIMISTVPRDLASSLA